MNKGVSLRQTIYISKTNYCGSVNEHGRIRIIVLAEKSVVPSLDHSDQAH